MIPLSVQVGELSTVASGGLHRPAPCAVVIFGATGDLARRKLIPALYNLAVSGWLPDRLAVVGVSRSVGDAAAWVEALRDAVAAFSRTQPIDEAVWARFAEGLSTVAGSLDDPDLYAALGARLDAVDRARGLGGRTLFYLAVPASAFPTILPRLQGAGLIQPPVSKEQADQLPWTRVIVEKPFGRDLDSARALNALAAGTLDESQIYRIDHYLGKETVQNLLVARFGNAIFEPLWNHKYVDHIQITAAETIGIEGRGAFYEETGVVRDIVQNHLLQVLALVAMEPPISFEANEIRDMKAQVLRALRPFDYDAIGQDVIFGQYNGYRAERGVDPASRTPTYTALRCFIDNWRWQGVPIYLRAGKGLSRRLTEVRVTFKSIPHCLFGRQDVCLRVDPNVLVFRIQPDEGMGLRIVSKMPGADFAVADVNMDFSYKQSFASAAPEAYERLLLDAMRGDATLFARRDEVETAWRFVSPILATWEAGAGQLAPYSRGSEGPEEAAAMLLRDGRRWEPLP